MVDADVESGLMATVQVPGLELRERIALAWRRDKVLSLLQQRLMREVTRGLRYESPLAADA